MTSRIKQLAQYAATKVVPTLAPRLNINGVDYGAAMQSLAVCAAKGNENLTDGVSMAGHHMSLKRVGQALDGTGIPGVKIERVGQMEWFGSRNAVFATEDRSLLLDPDNEIWQWGQVVYSQSERCRPNEFQYLLTTTRGFFELFNLGLVMHNTFDNKTGQFFPTRGNKYLKQLVQLFDRDENLAAYKFLSDFEKAGLLY